MLEASGRQSALAYVNEHWTDMRPRRLAKRMAEYQAATDTAWQDEYRRWRPPVERAIAWLVAHGNRRVRYRGVIANNIALHHRAAALNLRRLIKLGLTHASGTWHLAPTTP
ncbi:transposase [Streptomyces bluensis]